jgi:hypothetical protein
MVSRRTRCSKRVLRRGSSRRAPKKIRGKRGVELRLVVERFQDREHLPIVSLERAA